MSFLTLVVQTDPNTMLGYLAGANIQSNPSTGDGTGNAVFGYNAALALTTGARNTIVGNGAGIALTTGVDNVLLGNGAGGLLSGGAQANVAIGNVGTGGRNAVLQSVAVGAQALAAQNGTLGAQRNTALGASAGAAIIQGEYNTVLGYGAGALITSGSKNSILGSYTGNQGGLDIRTLSNYIVLSDGDGNPRLWIDNTGAANIPGGIVWSGGTANGVLYLNASNVVSSGNALVFTASSNLGIGVPIPVYKLDVVGSVGATARLGKLTIKDDSPFITGANIDSLTNNLAIGSNANTMFFTAGSEQMRLNSTGLGIGTNNPTQKLTVVGDIQQDNANYLRGKLAAGTVTRLFGLNSANSLYIGGIDASQSEILFVRGGSTQMILDSSGNLGLGVTPSAWTSIYRALQLTGQTALWAGSSNTFLSTNVYNDGGNSRYIGTGSATIYQQNAGAHAWLTAASGTAGNAISFTQAMTLDASGNLMVGTTSALGIFHAKTAKGSISIDQAGSIGSKLQFRNTSGTETATIYNYGGSNELLELAAGLANGFIVLSTGGTVERMRIDKDGNVIVNTAAIATNATNGFLYIPSCAGVPTGVPTTYTGRIPMVVDSTNNHVYFYIGGNWRYANTI